MTDRLTTAAAAATRAWVRLYTARMPAALRDARRAELEADLWDHRADARADGRADAAVAADVLLRAVLGALDDVRWRRESTHTLHERTRQGRIDGMPVSVTRGRSMGLLALAGGALYVVGGVVAAALGYSGRLEGDAGLTMAGVAVVAWILAMLGVIGLCLLEPGRLRWSARAGFVVILLGIGCTLVTWVAFLAQARGWNGGGPILSLSVVLLPLGLLVLGSGLPRPARYLPLLLGGFLVAKRVLGVGLTAWFPGEALYRPGSLLGITTSMLLGLGLAVTGYAIWSRPRAVAAVEHP